GCPAGDLSVWVRPVPVWRPLAGLIRSLSALLGRDPSQSCRVRFPAPDRPPILSNRRLEVEEMVADQLDYVVGVDSHRDVHALALIAASTGAVVFEAEVVAERRGYERALALASAHAAGRRLWAIEGSGSYGAGLARFLAVSGEQVVEVERPQRRQRRKGKSDRIDALRAARSALSETKLALPRASGVREALRALV